MARVGCVILASAFVLATADSSAVVDSSIRNLTSKKGAAVVKQVNCAFDIYGILLVVGKSGKAFYNVQKRCQKQETEEQRLRCASAVQSLVASLSFVATFTSGAVNDCAATLNVPAVCSGASSAFVAILNIMGAAFTNFKRACAEDDKGDDIPFRRLRGHHDAAPALSAANSSALFPVAKLPTSPSRALDADLEKRIKDSLADKQKRQSDITTCVLDVGLVSLFTGRGLLNVVKAAQQSPCVERFDGHPGEAEKACAVQITGIMATFEFVASLLAGVAAFCPIERNKPSKAKCAADSLLVMAGVSALVQEGLAMSLECGVVDEENEERLNEELEGDIIP